jgi:hypothetical protein
VAAAAVDDDGSQGRPLSSTVEHTPSDGVEGGNGGGGEGDDSGGGEGEDSGGGKGEDRGGGEDEDGGTRSRKQQYFPPASKVVVLVPT